MDTKHITYTLSLKTLDIYLEKSNGKILNSSRISRAPRQYMRTCAVEFPRSREKCTTLHTQRPPYLEKYNWLHIVCSLLIHNEQQGQVLKDT